MKTTLREYGDLGEDAAVAYLLAKGYKLLERNWTASHHEVDIIMRDKTTLVFVEVKTRQSAYFKDPIRAIDDIKLWNLLEAYKVYRRLHPIWYLYPFRIDSVCIVGRVGEFQIEHLEDPFRRRIQHRMPYRAHARERRGNHTGFFISGRKH